MVALTALTLASCASTRYPKATEEGLVKVARTPFDAVYARPGTDLRDLRRFSVDECEVTFRAHWLRDQNRERGPSRRVTTDDMQRIANTLALSCRQVLGRHLGSDGDMHDGPVITLQPALVDLDIAAPDVLAPGRERSLSSSSVGMRLVLDFVEEPSGELLGRVVDYRRSPSTSRPNTSTSVGNLADAERMLMTWSSMLLQYLQRGE